MSAKNRRMSIRTSFLNGRHITSISKRQPPGKEMFEQMRSDGVISTRGLKADAEKFGELIFDVNSAYFFNHGGYEFAKQFEENMGTYQRELGNFPPESAFIRLNTLQSNEGISNMLLLSLIGTYAALVLLVSSFTMLSVQQLTDAIEQKHRFDIIRKLGVERKECQKTARRQMYFWFGLPVLTAIVGSIGVFSYLLWSNYNEIIAYVLPSQIGIILTLSYISFIIVFGCYFVSTYYLFQRNIEKH